MMFDRTAADGSKARVAQRPFSVYAGGSKDFSGRDMTRIILCECDLQGASFRNCTLVHAEFGWADLRDVDFTGADLTDAHLNGADLRGADFRGAVLRNTEMDSAYTLGAIF